MLAIFAIKHGAQHALILSVGLAEVEAGHTHLVLANPCEI
jgi:hypothetical protein